MWNHIAKLNIQDFDNQVITLKVFTILSRFAINLGEATMYCKELIGPLNPIPLFD